MIDHLSLDLVSLELTKYIQKLMIKQRVAEEPPGDDFGAFWMQNGTKSSAKVVPNQVSYANHCFLQNMQNHMVFTYPERVSDLRKIDKND